MSLFLVTYDIQKTTMDPHSKVRNTASSYGWYDFHRDKHENFCYLPNTTLTGYFDKPSDAYQKFFELILDARRQCHGVLILEKYLITMMGDHVFESNEPYGH